MASINGLRASFFVSPNGVATARASRLPPSLRLRVFDRDGGVCVLCGQAVRRFARYRGDMSVGEVDHVVAVSRGGQNEPANLRLLCLSCNRGKSNQ